MVKSKNYMDDKEKAKSWFKNSHVMPTEEEEDGLKLYLEHNKELTEWYSNIVKSFNVGLSEENKVTITEDYLQFENSNLFTTRSVNQNGLIHTVMVKDKDKGGFLLKIIISFQSNNKLVVTAIQHLEREKELIWIIDLDEVPRNLAKIRLYKYLTYLLEPYLDNLTSNGGKFKPVLKDTDKYTVMEDAFRELSIASGILTSDEKKRYSNVHNLEPVIRKFPVNSEETLNIIADWKVRKIRVNLTNNETGLIKMCQQLDFQQFGKLTIKEDRDINLYDTTSNPDTVKTNRIEKDLTGLKQEEILIYILIRFYTFFLTELQMANQEGE